MTTIGKVLIVCGALGRTSEPWLWRQARGITSLQVSVLCWDYENRDLFPTEGLSTHVMNFPVQPMYGRGRWLLRLRNSLNGNFYGTVGLERRSLCALMDKEKPSVHPLSFWPLCIADSARCHCEAYTNGRALSWIGCLFSPQTRSLVPLESITEPLSVCRHCSSRKAPAELDAGSRGCSGARALDTLRGSGA